MKAGVVPREQIENNAQFRPEMVGVDVPTSIYSHISGIDIVRAPNASRRMASTTCWKTTCACPVGCVLHAGRPQDDDAAVPRAVQCPPRGTHRALPRSVARNPARQQPATTAEPTVVVLTPGMYNSAYFEHAFLAQQMGIELVEGQDLFVKDNFVYMRTTRGPRRVDVIYRRVDDDFLDPTVFRPTSDAGLRGSCWMPTRPAM